MIIAKINATHAKSCKRVDDRTKNIYEKVVRKRLLSNRDGKDIIFPQSPTCKSNPHTQISPCGFSLKKEL